MPGLIEVGAGRRFVFDDSVVEEDAAEGFLFGGEVGAVVFLGHGGDEVVGPDEGFEERSDRRGIDGDCGMRISECGIRGRRI